MNLLKRIRHGIEWRQPIYRDRIMSFWAQQCVKARWSMPRKMRPHGLPSKLVVSLTSYPPRFRTLALTLRCLLRQTVKADHTILWIAHADFDLLPPEVLTLQDKGLEICKTDDLKSYKKISPALGVFPEAFICTADDDLYYRADWLEELLDGVNMKERIVTCHRANEIRLDEQGNFAPYRNWPLPPPIGRKDQHLFPTSGGGALYPPGSLTHTVEDRENALELCPHADDVWLYWMACRNGAVFKITARRFNLISWSGSQEQALFRHNVWQDGNDDQIQKMAKQYGHPKIKDLREAL